MSGILSIITGSGNGLGSGHIQRMANLADFLRRRTPCRTYIVTPDAPDYLPPEIRPLVIESIHPSSSALVRDMRDSDIDIMRMLKQIAPVVSVDDCGPGRGLTDMSIDLLPNLANSAPRSDLFIYGFNFTESLRTIKMPIKKTIDVALYCGLRPPPARVQSLLSLVPGGLTCAILSGPDSRIISKGKFSPLPLSYAETLFASRVLVSHFGITLYEGYLAGCRLVSVNPTEYHSLLADIAAPDIHPVNLGLLHEADPSSARETILAAARNPRADSIDTRKALNEIELRLERFYATIQPLLDA